MRTTPLLASLLLLATLPGAGCGSPPVPRSAPRTTASGNPLGPSYVLMPLPGEDDSLLGRVIPSSPEAGRSLEEVSRANPCAEHLGEKRESAVASSFEYAEELEGSASAGALLGTFGFSADARRATHFVYKLGTDRRVSVVDAPGYEACCAEKGCGYGYVSALIHGEGEYATGEESVSGGGVDIPAIGSASGSVALSVLNKRKVEGFIAAVVTITDRKQADRLGPLGVAREAGIDEPTIGATTKAIYEREKMRIEQRPGSWVFATGADGGGTEDLKENEFIRRFRVITGSDELDDLERRRNTGSMIAYGVLTGVGAASLGGGVATLGAEAGAPGIILVGNGVGMTLGFGIPFLIALGKPDGDLGHHDLTERDARLYVDRYNRALLRATVRDVEKAHRESALPPQGDGPSIGLGPTGLQGTF